MKSPEKQRLFGGPGSLAHFPGQTTPAWFPPSLGCAEFGAGGHLDRGVETQKKMGI